jgi:hypothetical protein
MSQKTLLAILKAPSVQPIKPGQIVSYTDINGQTNSYRVNSVGSGGITLEINGELVVVQRSQIKTNDPPCLLDNIPLSEWQITSFDPRLGFVCVTIKDKIGTRTLSVTVPIIKPSNQ